MDVNSEKVTNRRSIVTSLPSDYSDVQTKNYDPEFISAISNKMQVPDSIPALNGDNDFNPRRSAGWADREESLRFHDMNVPERILVAGGGEHIGTKPEIRALNLDDGLPAANYEEAVGLLTPPRTLTLDEQFPSLEEDDVNKSSHKHHSNGNVPNRSVVQRDDFSPVSNSDSLMLEEDGPAQLRMQLALLSKRITMLEKQQTSQATKEMYIYGAAIGYMVLKFAYWFFRSK
ncbi:hypothetical protein ACF0H5_023249 [Mactra antiquata]